MGSAKSGLRRKGDESEEQEVLEESELEEESEDEDESDSEQNIDSEEQDDERDEETEEASDTEDSADDEDDEEDLDGSEDDDDVEQRARNSEAARRRIDSKKDKEIERLSKLVSKFQDEDNTRQREKMAVEIEETSKTIAGKYKTDPNFAKEILQTAVDIAEKRISVKLPPQAVVDDYEQRQEQRHFDSEWRPFSKTLAKEFPNAKPDQLEAARELMDDLAHDPETGGRTYKDSKGRDRLAGYSLSYILHENRSKFDSILRGKKRHSLESANMANYDESEEQADTSSARGIDKLDNMYKNIESNSSGLRRGRRPRSRTI